MKTINRYEELIAYARREASGGIRGTKFEVLRITEPYPEVLLIIYRYTSPGVPGSIESMVSTRFILWTPEGRTGGSVKTEFKEA